MKIYLIGMPGAGKSTLGQALAEELMMLFADLDTEIEQREGKSISEIFAQQGEDYFRQVESQVLREWASSNKSFVMATGGGTPCFYNGITIMNETGLSVFLDVPVQQLLQRLQSQTGRPLLNTDDPKEREERLTTLLSSRLMFYKQAKILVFNPDFQKLLKAINR